MNEQYGEFPFIVKAFYNGNVDDVAFQNKEARNRYCIQLKKVLINNKR